MNKDHTKQSRNLTLTLGHWRERLVDVITRGNGRPVRGDRGLDMLVAVCGPSLAPSNPQQLPHPISWKYVALLGE